MAGADLDAELETTSELTYCAVYPKGKRFPTTGWLTGSVCDLADLIHLVDVPETAFEKAADDLRESIDSAVSVLQFQSAYPLTDKIFDALKLDEAPKSKKLPKDDRDKRKNTQTRRIACAIIANALLFQERIAPAKKHIQPINHVCGKHVANPKQTTLDAWESILKINYFPIFVIGRNIVRQLPSSQPPKFCAL